MSRHDSARASRSAQLTDSALGSILASHTALRLRSAMSGAQSQAMWVGVAAGLEVVFGAGLVVAPALLASLLFGSEMNAAGDLLGRVSGLLMLCLALGCWPRAFHGEDRQPLAPLLALNLLATVFLIYVGMGGVNVGVLLWPAAAVHFILAALLLRAWMRRRAAGVSPTMR